MPRGTGPNHQEDSVTEPEVWELAEDADENPDGYHMRWGTERDEILNNTNLWAQFQ